MPIKISELPNETTPALASVMPIVEGGETRKTTVAQLGAAIAGLVVEISEPLAFGASRDLALTDIGKMLLCGNVTVTIEDEAEVAFPIGTRLHGITTTGQTTFAAVSPATVTPPPNCTLKTRGAGSWWELYKSAADTWYLNHDAEM